MHLIDRPDEPYCFRLHRDRVYYVSQSSMRLGISIARPNLVSLGTCFGKFSKSGKFKLHVTALDYLAQYAKYKVCTVIQPLALILHHNMHTLCFHPAARFGSNPMERCLFYMATTSLKRILVGLQRILQSIKVSLFII